MKKIHRKQEIQEFLCQFWVRLSENSKTANTKKKLNFGFFRNFKERFFQLQMKLSHQIELTNHFTDYWSQHRDLMHLNATEYHMDALLSLR